jgi:D-sedoheptulose 7-phosphate isomerase
VNDKQFLERYFGDLRAQLEPEWLVGRMTEMADAMLAVKERDGKLMLAGNGASASIASHFALDFTNQATVRSMSFNDAALLTAFANDFGYERWVAKAVAHYAQPGDMVVLISSSGRSANMLKAADQAHELGLSVATLTGFDEDNPLSARGDIRFWLDSSTYNVVESVHTAWLGALCDLVRDRLLGDSLLGGGAA